MTPWLLSVALAGDVQLLTYEDALKATVESNPALQRAALSAQEARSSVRSALGQFDPTLAVAGGWNQKKSLQFQPPFPDPFNSRFTSWNLGATVSGTAPTGTTVKLDGRMFQFLQQIEADQGAFTQKYFQPTFTLGLSQELLKGIRTKFNLQNVRHAKEGLSTAELQMEVARQDALAGTAKAYWSWVQAVELAEIAHHSVGVAEEALRVGAVKVTAGELAPLERTRLETAVVQAKSGVINADHTVGQALDQLLLLMGEQPGKELHPASAVGDADGYDLDAAKAVDVALQQSADLALARARVDQARLAVADARHATWPTLTASFEGGVNGGDGESWARAYQYLGGFPTVSLGGTFAVPLGNRAATGALQKASAVVATAEATLAEQERQIAASVTEQVRVLVAAQSQVELAEANVRLAEETLKAEEALQGVGRAILKDVLESRDAVEKARAELVRAKTGVRIAEVELKRLQGQVDGGT